jgi:hypothetical protein
LTSDDDDERRRAEAERRARVVSARSDIDRGHIAKPAKRDEREVYKPSAVKLGITKPSATATSLHILVIDNSASNNVIAEHLKKGSGYVLSMLGSIDPSSQIATIYFSDHCDGDGPMQGSTTSRQTRPVIRSCFHDQSRAAGLRWRQPKPSSARSGACELTSAQCPERRFSTW